MTYDLSFMVQHSLVQLSETAAAVHIGVEKHLPPSLLAALRAYHGKVVHEEILPRQKIRSLIQRTATRPSSGRSSILTDMALDEVAPDSPAVNTVNAIVADAVQARASDVHISSEPGRAVIRYRIDGALSAAGEIGRDRFNAVAARLKVLCRLNPSERRRAQDGRLSIQVEDDSFDVRFSALPTIHGESLVLRLFRQTRSALTLDDLGLCARTLFELRTAVERMAGLILVCGPTGSGKTTTLHACIRHLADGERKIVTIEDPVEYNLPGIDQVQTNDAVGLTFELILRRVLRQDPNVIMVGEIRDPATAGLALRAAVTGHLVLSTVHARRASDVTSRLEGLGVDQSLLASIEPLVVEQRLIRMRCLSCDGDGCVQCRGTGYQGRTGIFGISAGSHPSTTMVADGFRKVIAGNTTHEEVACVVMT